MSSLHSVLLNLLYLGSLGAIGYLAPRLRAFLNAHTTAEERAVIAELATVAISLIEQEFPTLDGPAKLQAAIKFVDDQLTRLHIPISAEEVEAAIERAYAEAKAAGLLSA